MKNITLMLLVAMVPFMTMAQKKSKKGKQNKTVTLLTNAIPSTKVLTIKGTVLVPKTK